MAAGEGADIDFDAEASDFESAPRLASALGAVLRFRWTGGAFGSLGFLGFLCFGGSWPPSVVGFGLTVVPGFRPGFLRGRPAAVNWTGRPSGPVPTFADLAPTIISSMSWLDVSSAALGGDAGGEMIEGGDESSGEERLGLALAITGRDGLIKRFLFPFVRSSACEKMAEEVPVKVCWWSGACQTMSGISLFKADEMSKVGKDVLVRSRGKKESCKRII